MTTSAIGPAGAGTSGGHKAWIRQAFTDARGRSFQVSVGVIRGARPGPVFANVAGQHGMEHIGPLVLRDLFDELDPSQIAGTLYLCPCANPLALLLNFEVHPERLENVPLPGQTPHTSGGQDGASVTYQSLGVTERNDLGDYNMNRLWPDDIDQDADDQAVAQRVTRWLWKTMIAPAHVVLDHHSVKHSIKPYIFCEQEVIDWAPVFGCEGVWCTGPLVPAPTPYPYRRLCMQAIRKGKVGLCIEYSRQYEVVEADRAIGRFAVLNTMRAMGMIEGEPEIPRDVWLVEGPYWNHLEELKAQRVGHVHFYVDEYQWLTKGQLIATVRDVQTHDVLEEFRASRDCLMLHRTFKPVVQPGQWVCRVSSDVRRLAKAGERFKVPALAC